MLKVTQTDDKAGTTLILEGKVLGPWVDELQSCWSGQATHQDGNPIRVDLRDVSYVDARGRDLLNRMASEGAVLVEASDFIRYVLGSDGAGDGLGSGKRDSQKI